MIDSATTVNGIGIVGQILQAIAQQQGNAAVYGIIGTLTTAICSVVSFIFGHSHGKKSAKEQQK